METIIQNLQNQSWWTIATSVIALFSAIAAISPTPAPGSTWSKVYAVIDFLALNIGKAKDAGVSPPVVPK